MKTVRTPEARFEGLPDYPFAPNYSEVPDGKGGTLRIHHLDEGPSDGEIVLCLHGQPTWSYLYRHMIPVFVAAGYRVLAPDFIGFGKSDKPVERSHYTYANHVSWMSAWLEGQGIQGANLFCQDWGGLIGLRLVAAHPERFARVVAANTGMPDGLFPPEAAAPMHALYEKLPVVTMEELWDRFSAPDGPPGFLFWRKYCSESPDFSVGDVMEVGARVAPEVRAAYEAPFPGPEYEAGAREFPSLVPVFPDNVEVPANKSAWEHLAAFSKPFRTSFSDDDPVTAGMEKVLQARIAGAQDVDHITIAGGGHFLQENQGPEVATAMIDFMRRYPSS
ncbi:haloalkane dehalogenase [Myxococcota bacterium]|nr:haloalkane dehalogenase [Myxococcota bacterium]